MVLLSSVISVLILVMVKIQMKKIAMEMTGNKVGQNDSQNVGQGLWSGELVMSRNIVTKDLHTAKYAQRIVKSKKQYSRKKKHESRNERDD